MNRDSSEAPTTSVPSPRTTKRAYTLRLKRAPGPCPSCGRDSCNCWRESLWATHEAVNRGAKAFGDWLLTLRGGLDHALADAGISPGDGKPRRDSTDGERRNRRILLALSWLSVEDERGAPSGDLRVASGRDDPSERQMKVLTALANILRARGVTATEIGDPNTEPEDQPGTWIGDCGPSLTAAIREDAVWVNRSAAFDMGSAEANERREYAQTTIMWFFGRKNDYFTLPEAVSNDVGAAATEGPEFRRLARQWVSINFGTGQKSNTDQIAGMLRELANTDFSRLAGRPKSELVAAMSEIVGRSSLDFDDLRIGIGWSTGRKSKGRVAIENLPASPTLTEIKAMQERLAEEADDKENMSGLRQVPPWMADFQKSVERACGMPFVGGRDHIGEYSVMLDHAARRVSIAHSWIKRAEAQRQRFTKDARRIDLVPPAARDWLDRFCDKRSEASGAVGVYRIRPRAIEGWDEVVPRWASPACRTTEDRIAAARKMQDEPEIEKFGDIQLFEALAADDAESVWRVNGEVTSAPLENYVAATDALAKQRRFKVPAYRHPDPLAHPVFADFGNSRWDIRFAIHEAARAAAGRKHIGQDGRNGLRMRLWDGHDVCWTDLRWSSKRLLRDLGLRDAQNDPPAAPVPRADRLGRAAAGLNADEPARAAGLFDQKHWNGRLQAPRAQLNAIWNRVIRQNMGWDATAVAMRDRIRWLVSFSPDLQCHGPFVEYAARHGIRPNRRGEYDPHDELNKREKRKGHARLILSRLPGLRVLSVDLGHRYAAACTVWEALSRETFEAEIEGRKIVHGGKDANSLYCHTRHEAAGRPRTTIYRRIGPDTLPDGSPHPAPWARLERQFLIKLQGEDEEARKAGPAEVAAVQELEKAVGREPPDRRSLRVDDLMSETVRTMRLALQRHGRRARIAFNLTSSRKLLPGGREKALTDEGRVELLADTLADWYALFTGKGWTDEWAREQWETHVTPLLQGATLPQIREDGEATPKARKEYRADLTEKLKPVAERLAGNDALCGKLRDLWATHWRENDVTLQERLRWLRDWILPRGRKAKTDRAIRHVGGLSLTRIATIKSLYQVQKAFHMRPEPEDLRKNIPSRGDDALSDFGRSILDVMERMREQRVKQLASRIVEAALGIGRMKPAKGRDRRRPRSRVDAPCHAVVIEFLRNYRPDELLTRRENRALMNWSAGKIRKYLEEACRLHGLHLREVMPNYTSRQCSRTGLPGLRCDDVPVDEFLTAPWWRKAVNAARKKLQDGNSAAAEASLLVHLHDHWAARPQSERHGKTVRLPRRGGDLFVAAPPPSCRGSGQETGHPCNGSGALQADLNAAANIGLRALMDPDFPGKWWYVPCIEDKAAGTAIPRPDKVGGSACFGDDPNRFGSLSAMTAPAGTNGDAQAAQKGTSARKTSGRRKKNGSRDDGREITNYWRDPSGRSLRPADKGGFWLPTTVYWQRVHNRAVAALYSFNGLTPPPAMALESQDDV